MIQCTREHDGATLECVYVHGECVCVCVERERGCSLEQPDR